MFMENIKEFVIKNKFWIVGVVITLILGFGVGFGAKNTQKEESLTFQEETFEEENEMICSLYSDISGAVLNPGVYCLKEGSIISDLINEAGGFNGEECLEWVSKNLNRAQIVSEGQKVYIQREKDIECSGGGKPVTEKIETNNKISINNSTQSEIESLPGIGPSIAGKIISARPYSTLEDLLEVKGIGTAIFEKIKSLVVL